METIIVGLLAAAVFIAGCCFLYWKIRPLFPVRVNCWFCSRDARVPYGNKNCWDCPNCEQYNGFTADGDFNKPVPAQFTEDINHPVRCQPSEFLTRGEFLCPSCQRNQLLKVKQLAAFEPLNEAAYDEEIAFYQRHLESVYALCLACESRVQEELRHVDSTLEKHNSSAVTDKSLSPEKSCSEDVGTSAAAAQTRRNDAKLVLQLSSVVTFLCAVVLLFTELCRVIPELGKFWEGVLCQWLQDNIVPVAPSVCGLAVCMMSKVLLGKDRLLFRDVVHILTWLTAVLSSMPDSQEFVLPLHAADFCLHLVMAVLLVVLEMSVSLTLTGRHQTNATTPVIKRLSLDGNTSSAHSEAVSEAVSSVSTSCRRRLVPDGGSSDSLAKTKNITNPRWNMNKAPAEGSSQSGRDGQMLKSELDTLGNDLNGFWIGRPPSESGYSTATGSASSSVFGQCTFTSASAGLSAGVAFPRPLISPARLSHVKFSNNAGNGKIYNNFHPKSQQMFSSAQHGKMQPGGHYNIFLAQESRPHSMFTQHSYSKDTSNFNFKHQGKSNSIHRDKESFGQAPSLFGHSSSSGSLLLKQPMPEKTELSTHEQPSSKSLWRDSSVVDGADDEREAPDSTRLSETKLGDVECDSTTPSLSFLSLDKRDGLQQIPPRAAFSQFSPLYRHCPKVSDDEEDVLSYGIEAAKPDTSVRTKSEFSRWLVFSVMVALVSVAANLLLAWSVLSSR